MKPGGAVRGPGDPARVRWLAEAVRAAGRRGHEDEEEHEGTGKEGLTLRRGDSYVESR